MSLGIAELVPFGLEKTDQSTSSSKRPLGSLGANPNGDIFAWGLAGEAIAVGLLLMQEDVPADQENDMVLGESAAVGATSIELDAGGSTALVKNEFAGGLLSVNDSTGEGQSWRIKANDVAATGVQATFTFMPNDSVRVALTAAASQFSLVHNPYWDVRIWDQNDIDGIVLGYAPGALDDNDYGWIRTTGLTAALTDGVIVRGLPVQGSTDDNGGVEAYDEDGTVEKPIVGMAVAVAADGEYSIIKCTIGPA